VLPGVARALQVGHIRAVSEGQQDEGAVHDAVVVGFEGEELKRDVGALSHDEQVVELFAHDGRIVAEAAGEHGPVEDRPQGEGLGTFEEPAAAVTTLDLAFQFLPGDARAGG
jgi:hypothetical protein